MSSSLQRFKRQALTKRGVKEAYDALDDEFAFLDEVLKARAESGLMQAEVAERVGTTQAAIARLESAAPKQLAIDGYTSALCKGARLQA